MTFAYVVAALIFSWWFRGKIEGQKQEIRNHYVDSYIEELQQAMIEQPVPSFLQLADITEDHGEGESA